MPLRASLTRKCAAGGIGSGNSQLPAQLLLSGRLRPRLNAARRGRNGIFWDVGRWRGLNNGHLHRRGVFSFHFQARISVTEDDSIFKNCLDRPAVKFLVFHHPIKMRRFAMLN